MDASDPQPPARVCTISMHDPSVKLLLAPVGPALREKIDIPTLPADVWGHSIGQCLHTNQRCRLACCSRELASILQPLVRWHDVWQIVVDSQMLDENRDELTLSLVSKNVAEARSLVVGNRPPSCLVFHYHD